MHVTMRHYMMGRDVTHAPDLTQQITDNATELLRVVNILLDFAEADGVRPNLDEVTGTYVASGWRPPAVNDRTANSAKDASTHLTGRGIDLDDHLDRRLAVWCCKNLDVLKRLGLYMEDPRWTGGRERKPGEGERDPWVHLQIVPPKSGRRVYVPSATQAANDPDFYRRYGLAA